MNFSKTITPRLTAAKATCVACRARESELRRG